MMPQQGTLPHTRNSNESKRRRHLTPSQPARLRRRHRIGTASIKRRGCRHQNQAAARRRRRRRRLREYFKVVMLPEVNSCTMRPQLSPLVRRMRATTTYTTLCLAHSKASFLLSFFSLPPEIYIQSAPNNSNEPCTFFVLVQIRLFWVVLKLPLKAKVYYF